MSPQTNDEAGGHPGGRSRTPSDADSDPGVRIEDLDLLDNQILYRAAHDALVEAELSPFVLDTTGVCAGSSTNQFL